MMNAKKNLVRGTEAEPAGQGLFEVRSAMEVTPMIFSTTPPAIGQENYTQTAKIPPKNACLDFNKAPKQKTGGGRGQDHNLIGAAQAACERGWRYGDE